MYPSLLLGLALAAGAPQAKGAGKPAAYYPTRVGAKWVYDDNGERERTCEVTKVESTADGGTVVTVGETLPPPRGCSSSR